MYVGFVYKFPDGHIHVRNIYVDPTEFEMESLRQAVKFNNDSINPENPLPVVAALAKLEFIE